MIVITLLGGLITPRQTILESGKLYCDLNHPALGYFTLEEWRKIGVASLKGKEKILVQKTMDPEKLIGMLYIYSNINLNERY